MSTDPSLDAETLHPPAGGDHDWYAMHDHGYGRHLHSTAQGHSGDVNNPKANDHTGVAVLPSLDEARAFAAPTS